ncbi:MAG TPA: anaerobic ribonucleoside-triphosphate reductase [Nitrososphaerales archaeon]|nr:anaerobic ribonucleoside-triphosphate reductase [Nitrososphaerales archaeon]
MQAAPRRVRTIYSVIASPQRLEILKILNVKGPLTYSALKSLAGFKSKKESGKFAYHLRKLVRQLLIQLNRQERKYTVTNLGRLVLNLTRQIEEQSLIESGKLYVRTSRQAMEEFNADKILQSLVKEAGMPVELAQKITSETESRLYKFQTQYLTAPLIREMVNSLLVEQNLEEYRHKLTRLGMPVFDVTQLLAKAGGDQGDAETLLHQTGKSVFAEYLLLEQLPRDVADAHLNGDIHISEAGTWALLPDTVFLDLLSVRASGFNPKGRLPGVPMLQSPTNLEEAVNVIANIVPLVKKEANQEVVFNNFLQYLAQFTRSRTKKEVGDALLRFFDQVSSALHPLEKPGISLQLDVYVKDDAGRELMEKTLGATLDAYRDYIDQVPRPEVRLLLAKPNKSEEASYLKEAAAIIFHGGRVSFFQSGQRRSSLGINLDVLPADKQGDNVSVLHNLGINLPRLSYESNQDETYFRAKLSMLMGVASDAMITRRRLLERVMNKGLLPALSFGSDNVGSEAMPLVMNLVGLDEALSGLNKEAAPAARAELASKILGTAAQSASDKSGKGERLGIALIEEEGAARLAQLDSERYGRANLQSLERRGYSQAAKLTADDLGNAETIGFLDKVGRGAAGGLSVFLDASALDLRGIYNLALGAVPKLEFFSVDRTVSFCRNCGSKLPAKTERCAKCRSTATAQYSTAE